MPPALAQLEDLDHTIEHGVVAVEDFIRETASKTRQREELNDRRIDEITNAVSGKVAGSLESRLEHLERTLDANLGQVRQIALWRRACLPAPMRGQRLDAREAPVPTRSHSRAVRVRSARGCRGSSRWRAPRRGARRCDQRLWRFLATTILFPGPRRSRRPRVCWWVDARALRNCPRRTTHPPPRVLPAPPCLQAPGFPSSARRPCCNPCRYPQYRKGAALPDENERAPRGSSPVDPAATELIS